jgi:trans-aconitate methyltransferase
MTAAPGRTTSTRAGAGPDWSDPENAACYANFADDSNWYDRLAADLVDRAKVNPGAVVIDLCAGVGAVTTALLARCDPAVVHAVDASAAMLAQGRRRIGDPRVRWHQVSAQRCTQLGIGIADRVVCSASLWDLPVAEVSAAVGAVLRPGGRMVFNLPPSVAGATVLSWSESLRQNGFRVLSEEPIDYFMTTDSLVGWMSIPAFFPGPALGGPDDRQAFLRSRFAAADRGRRWRMTWTVVAAESSFHR